MNWPMGIIDEAIETGELPSSCHGSGCSGELNRQEREELIALRQRVKDLEADLVKLGRRCEAMKTTLIMLIKEDLENAEK